VTRIWSNRTSGKSNKHNQCIATLPYHKCTPSTFIKLLKAGFNRCLFWVLWQAHIWPCEEPGFTRTSGKWVHAWTDTIGQMFSVWFLLHISHYKELVQPYNFISRLYSPFEVYHLLPPPPSVSTDDTLSDFLSYLVGNFKKIVKVV